MAWQEKDFKEIICFFILKHRLIIVTFIILMPTRPKKWQLGTVFLPDSLGWVFLNGQCFQIRISWENSYERYMLGTNCFAVISLRVGRYKVIKIQLWASHEIKHLAMFNNVCTRWRYLHSSLLVFAAAESLLHTGICWSTLQLKTLLCSLSSSK